MELSHGLTPEQLETPIRGCQEYWHSTCFFTRNAANWHTFERNFNTLHWFFNLTFQFLRIAFICSTLWFYCIRVSIQFSIFRVTSTHRLISEIGIQYKNTPFHFRMQAQYVSNIFIQDTIKSSTQRKAIANRLNNHVSLLSFDIGHWMSGNDFHCLCIDSIKSYTNNASETQTIA